MRTRWQRQRIELLDRTFAVYSGQNHSSPKSTIMNYDRHLDCELLADHVCHPGIISRVQGALGPDIVCWRTEFFAKYPGDEGTDWHQADTFANASGKPQIVWPEHLKKFGGTITVWTAFTDSNEETGCLQFVPGTHERMFYDESKGMHYSPQDINMIDKRGVRRG